MESLEKNSSIFEIQISDSPIETGIVEAESGVEVQYGEQETGENTEEQTPSEFTHPGETDDNVNEEHQQSEDELAVGNKDVSETDASNEGSPEVPDGGDDDTQVEKDGTCEQKDEATGISQDCKLSLEKMKEEIRSSENKPRTAQVVTMKDRYKMACIKYDALPFRDSVLETLEKEEVDLSDLNLGDIAFRPIVETLFFSDYIRKLYFSNVRIGIDGLERLSYLFAVNGEIEYLDISKNNFGPRGKEYIQKILDNSPCLEYLDMSVNGMRDSQLLTISQSINNCPNLTTLILKDNEFQGTTAKDLAECLLTNERLEKLDLSYNKLKTRGASLIFQSLKSNNCLKALNLAANDIGSESGMDLGKALEANSCLEEVDLSRNFLSKECCAPIGKGLKSNSTLKSLKLAYNPLFAQGAATLLNAIATATDSKLEVLDLGGVRVNHTFLKSLMKIRASENNLDVKYGHRMRCELCEAYWPQSLVELMEYADSKGTSLRSTMTKIYSNFFAEKRNEENRAAETGTKPKVAEIDEITHKERFPMMDSTKLVQNLMACPIKVPENLARQFVIEFANDLGAVDIGEVILKIPLRTDILEYEKEKPETSEAKEKKKGGKK